MRSQFWSRSLGAMALWQWLAVGAYAALLYGYNLGGFQALTEHEIVVAGIAKQMLRDGTWGGLWIGDYPWLEKPPLPHWLAALSLSLVGDIGEAAVRLPSAIEGIAVALIVAGLAARWFGATTGLLSGLVQASAWYMMTYARLAENDMVLCLLVTATLACFVAAQRAPAERLGRWRLAFWLLLGATNLSKGPLFGAALVGAVCGAWVVWRRDGQAVRRMVSPLGLLLFAALALAWPAWVYFQGLGPLLAEWWRFEMFGRVDGTYFPVAEPPWYYLLTLTWQWLPWTPFLLIGAAPSLARAWRDRDSGDRFLWCWAAAPILLLSLPPHKHHHYIIHALPGFAPIVALGLARAGGVATAWAGRLPARAATSLVVGGLALAVGLALLSWHLRDAGATDPEFAPLGPDAALIGTILGLGLAALGLWLARPSLPGLALVYFATVLAVLLTLRSPYLADRDPSRFDREFLRGIAAQIPPGARLIVTGRQPLARHLFYLDRPGRRAEGVWVPEDIAKKLRPGEVAYVVTRAEDEPGLSAFAKVERLAVSVRTRSERGPAERYTLFRLTAR
ncbi:MAG: glycosyltransferase family 39 protein [Alphaproteobacteria bacterium]|nr:glycosyltransferase family 39 protein [Alphaproteobacteria bacterium]